MHTEHAVIRAAEAGTQPPHPPAVHAAAGNGELEARLPAFHLPAAAQDELREASQRVKCLIKHIHREERESPPAAFAERMADAVTDRIGRWGFIGAISAATVGWMGINSALQRVMHVVPDAFPYPLANLGFALVGALTGPVILMSQNRREQQERARNAEYQDLQLLRAHLLLSRPEAHLVPSKNIDALKRHLEGEQAVMHPERGERSVWGRFADKTADFLASWKPVTIMSAASVAWIAVNEALKFAGILTLDPFPYIFLNLALSGISALTAPIVLMSHNQQAARDDRRTGWFRTLDVLCAKADVELSARGAPCIARSSAR